MDFLMLYIAAAIGGGGITFFVMKLMGYARWAQYNHSEGWYQERFARQANRTLWIKNWASMRMASVPPKLRNDERQVLVTYKDLLNVWDLSDKIWMDLGD